MLRPVLASLLAVLGLAVPGASTAAAMPPIQHVFTIVLENKDYEVTFGEHSPAPYLAHDLPAQGKLLTHYYGTSHAAGRVHAINDPEKALVMFGQFELGLKVQDAWL